MTPKKLNYILIGLLAILAAVIGGALYWSNGYLRNEAASVAEIKVELAAVEAQEAIYTKSRNDLKAYASLQESIEKILPKDKDQARAISELFAIAEESDIRITQISFPTSELGRGASAAAGSGAATPAQASSAVTQAKPVKGISGVLGITASIEVDPISPAKPITYDRFIEFLRKLEINRRTMQVSQVTIVPIEKNAGGKFDFSVNLTIFVKP